MYTDFTMHISSTHSPRLGKISLTSMPLLPYFLNLNGDFIRLPVLRSCCRSPPGMGWPLILLERRLVVEAVDLRQAAIHERER